MEGTKNHVVTTVKGEPAVEQQALPCGDPKTSSIVAGPTNTAIQETTRCIVAGQETAAPSIPSNGKGDGRGDEGIARTVQAAARPDIPMASAGATMVHPETEIVSRPGDITTGTISAGSIARADMQATMLATITIAKSEAARPNATTPSIAHEPAAPASSKELKCKTCLHCKDERVPAAILQKIDDGKAVVIKFNPQCGHPCTIVINKDFEIEEHICTSYVEQAESTGPISDFDFDRFISGSEDLDDFLLKQKTRQASKLVTLEDQMKVAVKKLVKPLAILVPTVVQKKTEDQLRAEREDRLRKIVEIEGNIVYLRVLEFEKAAMGNNSYSIDKFSKMLKDLDKKHIIGFIQKINNDFLISYNDKTQTVRFYNPSKPELEILSREFEKWLRFNRT